jgi:hypothetical protein
MEKNTCEKNHTIVYNSEEAPECMSGHSANIVDQNLYIFGGYDGDTRFNQLWQIQNVTSIRTKSDELKWERVPLHSQRPITGRAGHACQSILMPSTNTPQLFIHGGYDSDRNVLSDTLRIDTVLRECHVVTPKINDAKLVLDRRWHASWAFDNKMFIHGGWNDQGPIDSIGYNDLKNNTWNSLATVGNKPSPRRWHATTLVPNTSKVIMSGGYDGNSLDDMWEFDLERGVWAQFKFKAALSKVPTSRCRHSLVIFPHRPKELYIIGGFTGQSATTPSTKPVLVTLDDMTVREASIENFFDLVRAGQSATLLPDNSFVLFGGIDAQGKATNDLLSLYTNDKK